MKTVKLTQRLIESLPVKSHAYTVWDSQAPLLGVRVCRDGQCFYLIRTAQGRHKIALVAQISLKTARQHAQKILDTSLAPIRKTSGRLIRFDALVSNEWRETVMAYWKPSTQGAGRSALNAHLLDEFGRYPVHLITPHHVQRWFDGLSQTYAGAANRNLDVLRSIFTYAMKQGYCRQNPCDGIKQNRKRTLNRFLSYEELSRLDKALKEVSLIGEMEACCCQVLRLTLLTGCRISEVTGLQWSFVKGSEWHLPDSKTGAKIVYVGLAAQKVVSQIRKQHRESQSEDVFAPLRGFVSRATKVGMIWGQVRALADICDVRIHDLRHTFASYAVLEGYPIPMVAALLGHKRISSTLRYTHVSESHVEAQAQTIGQALYDVLTDAPQSVKKPPCRRKTPQKTKTRTVKKTNDITEPVSTITDKQIQRYRDELDFLTWD